MYENTLFLGERLTKSAEIREIVSFYYEEDAMGKDVHRCVCACFLWVSVLALCCEEEEPLGDVWDPASSSGSGDNRSPADSVCCDTESSDSSLEVDTLADGGPRGEDSDRSEDGDLDAGEHGEPTGWIGSPCLEHLDCQYEGGFCIGDYPQGMCTLPCDLYCPDRDEFPMTFCTTIEEVPGLDPSLEGACLSRCDYGIYPKNGCRAGYGCVLSHRANAPHVERYVCLPGQGESLSDCQSELAFSGVAFEPAAHHPESPEGYPHLTCQIADPVRLHFPVHGLGFVNSAGNDTASLLMSCPMALAVAETARDLASQDVVNLVQGGVYNCRVIAGTETLSRHAYGDAIDIFGFEFADGDIYTVIDDWEEETTAPQTEAGVWLYETVYRWHDLGIWNVILTPNYNTAHKDHFHVDLTPESHFIQSLSIPFIGPAPFVD